jgi:hypothetical protein
MKLLKDDKFKDNVTSMTIYEALIEMKKHFQIEHVVLDKAIRSSITLDNHPKFKSIMAEYQKEKEEGIYVGENPDFTVTRLLKLI